MNNVQLYGVGGVLLWLSLLAIGMPFGCFPAKDSHVEVAQYTATLTSQPADQTSLVNRCAHYINLAEYANAVADCTRALELQSNNTQALQNRATAYQRWGRLRESLTDWEQALTLMEQGEFWRRESPEQIKYARTQIWLVRQRLGGTDNSSAE